MDAEPNTRLKSRLLAAHCEPKAKGTPPLVGSELDAHLALLPGWTVTEDDPNTIAASFTFANFHETMAFVNAVAWIAHDQDHHPDLQISYKHCRVRYRTHSIGGLSDNDVICALRINALLGD